MEDEAIPEALVKFAQGLIVDMDCYGTDLTTVEGREHDARLIAAALLAVRLAERNRCIAVADGIGETDAIDIQGLDYAAGWSDCADQIAHKIRKAPL